MYLPVVPESPFSVAVPALVFLTALSVQPPRFNATAALTRPPPIRVTPIRAFSNLHPIPTNIHSENFKEQQAD
jgi:hypothetical protein